MTYTIATTYTKSGKDTISCKTFDEPQPLAARRKAIDWVIGFLEVINQDQKITLLSVRIFANLGGLHLCIYGNGPKWAGESLGEKAQVYLKRGYDTGGELDEILTEEGKIYLALGGSPYFHTLR